MADFSALEQGTGDLLSVGFYRSERLTEFYHKTKTSTGRYREASPNKNYCSKSKVNQSERFVQCSVLHFHTPGAVDACEDEDGGCCAALGFSFFARTFG